MFTSSASRMSDPYGFDGILIDSCRMANTCLWVVAFLSYHQGYIRARLRSLIPGGAAVPAAYDVFLSHDWGTDVQGRNNHERVSKVNAALSAAGLVTWFDEERMRGDVVQQMTDGIDRSSVVLVFVTSNYIRKVAGEGPQGANDNCKVR
jgi:hypothetical protein